MCVACVNISLGLTLLLIMLCWEKWVSKFVHTISIQSVFILYMIFNYNIMRNINALVNLIWFYRCIWFWGIDWIFFKCCIVFMPDFISYDYVYFKYNEGEPIYFHKVFTLNQEPKSTIASPLNLPEKKLKSLTTLFVKTILNHLSLKIIQFVAQLSIIDPPRQTSLLPCLCTRWNPNTPGPHNTRGRGSSQWEHPINVGWRVDPRPMEEPYRRHHWGQVRRCWRGGL